MERNSLIDAIKGILILLVIIGHSIQYGNGYTYLEKELFYNNFFFRSIYSFHMPMFMMVSGYLFGYSNIKTLGVIVISKLKSLGIPFVAFCSVIYPIWWYCNDMTSFYFCDFFMKMRINMWFLSSVLLNCIIVGVITHVFKSMSVWIILAFFILLFFVSDSLISAQHKYMFFFFIVGFYLNLMKNISSVLIKKMTKPILFPFLTVLFICVVYSYDDYMFIYKSGLCFIREGTLNYNVALIDVIRYLEALFCCLWFFSLMRILKQYICKKSIIKLGKYTLCIYGAQSVCFTLVLGIKCPIIHVYSFNIMPYALFFITLSLSLFFIEVCLKSKIMSFLFLGKSI